MPESLQRCSSLLTVALGTIAVLLSIPVLVIISLLQKWDPRVAEPRPFEVLPPKKSIQLTNDSARHLIIQVLFNAFSDFFGGQNPRSLRWLRAFGAAKDVAS